jgi:hypothetical protein
MVSCCAGAELQIRRGGLGREVEIILRELYPMKSDLYERARALEAEYLSRPQSSRPEAESSGTRTPRSRPSASPE